MNQTQRDAHYESASDATSMGNSVLDSPHERAYGTFEVSVIEVESDTEQPARVVSKSLDFDAQESCHTCTADCCVLVSFLWMPFRLQTYAVVAFHIVNFLFAVGAASWTMLLYLTKAALSSVKKWSPSFRQAESTSLRILLHTDAALFNLGCPSSEKVIVYSSTVRQSQGAYGFYPQLYFGVAKLVCSALPGVVSALTFLWSICNLLVVVRASFVNSSDEQTAPIENDVLILLAIVTLHAAAALTKVFAVISRHITIFFCAEHLIYATSS